MMYSLGHKLPSRVFHIVSSNNPVKRKKVGLKGIPKRDYSSTCCLLSTAAYTQRNQNIIHDSDNIRKSPAGREGGERRRYLVAGNWKCNGLVDEQIDRIKLFNSLGPIPSNTDVAICCPYVHIPILMEKLRGDIQVGAQDCGANAGNGAYTGEIGSHMLKDIGCSWVIVGHSERRRGAAAGGGVGESNELCAEKAKAAINNGLNVMFAIGETKHDREQGITEKVCAEQLSPLLKTLESDDWAKLAIAYEPVWAIGTGVTATAEIAQETHKGIRNWIYDHVSTDVARTIRIQYGGSMAGSNAEELLSQPDIDGGLIGGASLEADFFNVINAVPK